MMLHNYCKLIFSSSFITDSVLTVDHDAINAKVMVLIPNQLHELIKHIFKAMQCTLLQMK